MKIAIPIFGNRVSPRFEFSPEIWFIEVERGEVLGEERLSTTNLNLPQRLEQITSNGVDKIICGGIDVFARNQLASKGIDVIQDVIGEAEVVLELFIRGKLRSGIFCDRRRSGRFCGWRIRSHGRRS
ncbi:MAG: NifB/NifX family molybdenum-iron cluster-binding protein [Thermodesulfobacteriota bacterium]